MPSLVVWIVAVERHAPHEGSASALDIGSPVTSTALQFAEVALEHVPDARVYINASHPGRPEDLKALQRLTLAGAKVADATVAAIGAVPAQLAGADAMLLYWVGHGVMQAQQRMLVTADSQTAEQLWAVDVDGLLSHLRSQAQPALQLGFFDCCAQVVSNTPTRLHLAQHQPTDRHQHYYFSASAGEIASADTRRLGFTQSALAALREAQWPIDPAAVGTALRAKLASLPLASRPAELRWTDGSGDLWSSAGSGAAQAALELHAKLAQVSPNVLGHLLKDAGPAVDAARLAQALIDDGLDALLASLDALYAGVMGQAVGRWRLVQPLLGPATNLALYWRDWYRLAAGEIEARWAVLPHATDLPGLLLELLDRLEPQVGIDSMIRVLESAARLARPAAAAALREAIQASAVLQPRFAQAVAELPPANTIVFLLAAVSLPAGRALPVVDAAWLMDGDHRQTLTVPPADDGMAGQLNVLFEPAVSRATTRKVVVELILPSDLLCAPRRLLEFTNELLGVRRWLERDWPIVVRWRERLDPDIGPRRFNAAVWKQRAFALNAARAPGAHLTCTFADAAGAADIVALPFPGPTLGEPQRHRQEFFQALLNGHPFMCWPREPVADDAAFRARVQQLVRTSQLDDLALALAREKEGPDTTLHDLLLMIDDPARNPLAKDANEPGIGRGGP